jgi:hypothetical protein
MVSSLILSKYRGRLVEIVRSSAEGDWDSLFPPETKNRRNPTNLVDPACPVAPKDGSGSKRKQNINESIHFLPEFCTQLTAAITSVQVLG